MNALRIKTAASRKGRIPCIPGIWLIAAWAAFSLTPCAPGAAGGAPLTIDADNQVALAESLFNAGDFAAAIVEYQRLVYFFPEDARVDMAMYRIGQAYLKDKRYARAIEAFLALIDRFPQSPWTVPGYLGIAACHLQSNAPALAVTTLEALIAATDDPDVVDEANYRIGWIYLEMADWGRARAYFDRIRPEKRAYYRLQQLSLDLEKASSIPKKNPATAGFLALIPGAGHAYCGRYQDALVALAVNTALIAAAVESFDNDLPILGGVISAVALGFYTGSIFSAVGSAHKYNRAREREFIDSLRKESRPSLFLGASSGGLMAGLRISF
jgi:tetratricopeptide (TPR) repeat protein